MAAIRVLICSCHTVGYVAAVTVGLPACPRKPASEVGVVFLDWEREQAVTDCGATLTGQRPIGNWRSPKRTPPFLLEHYDIRTKVIRTATASERPSVGPVARVTMSLRASLYGLPASTRCRLTMNLATNQRAQRRDRTNVCMCHLDHLL